MQGKEDPVYAVAMGANIPVRPFPWIPVLLALACADAVAQPADMKPRGMEQNGPDMNGTRIGSDPEIERGLRVVQLRQGVRLADGTKLSDVVAKGSALLSPSKSGASFIGARSPNHLT